MSESDGARGVRPEASRWLEQATEDYRSAEVLLEAGRHYMVCFVSQQIAEKALKAYLYAQGRDWVFGHSVSKLCLSCAEGEDAFVALHREIKNLDQYYIEARYPNGLPESIPAEFYNEEDAHTALGMAAKALRTVEGFLDLE